MTYARHSILSGSIELRMDHLINSIDVYFGKKYLCCAIQLKGIYITQRIKKNLICDMVEIYYQSQLKRHAVYKSQLWKEISLLCNTTKMNIYYAAHKKELNMWYGRNILSTSTEATCSIQKLITFQKFWSMEDQEVKSITYRSPCRGFVKCSEGAENIRDR